MDARDLSRLRLLTASPGESSTPGPPPNCSEAEEHKHFSKIYRSSLKDFTRLSKTCGACHKFAADTDKKRLLMCAKCKTTTYCSKECQKSDWQKHKVFCTNPHIKIPDTVFTALVVNPLTTDALRRAFILCFNLLHKPRPTVPLLAKLEITLAPARLEDGLKMLDPGYHQTFTEDLQACLWMQSFTPLDSKKDVDAQRRANYDKITALAKVALSEDFYCVTMLDVHIIGTPRGFSSTVIIRRSDLKAAKKNDGLLDMEGKISQFPQSVEGCLLFINRIVVADDNNDLRLRTKITADQWRGLMAGTLVVGMEGGRR